MQLFIPSGSVLTIGMPEEGKGKTPDLGYSDFPLRCGSTIMPNRFDDIAEM
jgi:hypothetical protein